MKPAPFELIRPETLDHVLALLREHGDKARVLAGGQSLVPMMNLRIATPDILVDLNTVSGLAGIRRDGDWIHIGAMTRQQHLLQSEIIWQYVPLMYKALANVGHYQTRCRGTIGGSLAHADPSAELALIAVALGAEMHICSASGNYKVEANAFFVDAMTTILNSGDVLTEITVPIAPAVVRTAFHEHARRYGDFALASAAAQHDADASRLTVAVGAVGTVPHPCREIADAARSGAGLGDLLAVAEREVAAIDALDDVYTSADYRRTLGVDCLQNCLRELFK